jgi:hypothetical protein
MIPHTMSKLNNAGVSDKMAASFYYGDYGIVTEVRNLIICMYDLTRHHSVYTKIEKINSTL